MASASDSNVFTCAGFEPFPTMPEVIVSDPRVLALHRRQRPYAASA